MRRRVTHRGLGGGSGRFARRLAGPFLAELQDQLARVLRDHGVVVLQNDALQLQRPLAFLLHVARLRERERERERESHTMADRSTSASICVSFAYLERVLLARVVERDHVEAERFAGHALDQHQVGALRNRVEETELRDAPGDVDAIDVDRIVAHQNVRFVAQTAVLLALADEQDAVEQEDVARSFGSVDTERALGHQFAVRRQVLALRKTTTTSLTRRRHRPARIRRQQQKIRTGHASSRLCTSWTRTLCSCLRFMSLMWCAMPVMADSATMMSA